ncbi:hypothetical protein [Streptomyces sp. NPDC088789]|uniref:hypothetical protein n=1 Tax=Streptomyces sp. NPDC088789 TaxID=3365899 RepID=UPI00380C5DBC
MSAVENIPQPPGTPRWVAMFYEPASASWRIGAESPYRAPVTYALGEMAQTLRARGEAVTVSLWGPERGGWRCHDSPLAAPDAPLAPDAPDTTEAPTAPERPIVAGSAKLAERMTDRRQQVLLAGLGQAGVYDLTPEDEAAVAEIVDRLDETAVRRLAHWLARPGAQ